MHTTLSLGFSHLCAGGTGKETKEDDKVEDEETENELIQGDEHLESFL